jgi:hypothetical protein
MIKKSSAQNIGKANLDYINETGKLPPKDLSMNDRIFDIVKSMNKGGMLFGYENGGDIGYKEKIMDARPDIQWGPTPSDPYGHSADDLAKDLRVMSSINKEHAQEMPYGGYTKYKTDYTDFTDKEMESISRGKNTEWIPNTVQFQGQTQSPTSITDPRVQFKQEGGEIYDDWDDDDDYDFIDWGESTTQTPGLTQKQLSDLTPTGFSGPSVPMPGTLDEDVYDRIDSSDSNLEMSDVYEWGLPTANVKVEGDPYATKKEFYVPGHHGREYEGHQKYKSNPTKALYEGDRTPFPSNKKIGMGRDYDETGYVGPNMGTMSGGDYAYDYLEDTGGFAPEGKRYGGPIGYKHGGKIHSRNYKGGGPIQDHMPLQTYGTKKQLIESQMNSLVDEMISRDDVTKAMKDDSPKMRAARAFLSDIDRQLG